MEKAHVQRASVAADAALRFALAGDTPDAGVVLMTALVLVERLASSYQCEPRALLAKMANCFELKRQLMARFKHDA